MRDDVGICRMRGVSRRGAAAWQRVPRVRAAPPGSGARRIPPWLCQASAALPVDALLSHIVTMPLPGHGFLHVSSSTFEEPFASLFWVPEEGAELLLMDVIEDIVWVREYLRAPVDPHEQPRLPRIGVAHLQSHSTLGHPPVLGVGCGSILVSFCTGLPWGRLPIFSWYPLRPIGWPGGYTCLTVKWLSFAPDI